LHSQYDQRYGNTEFLPAHKLYECNISVPDGYEWNSFSKNKFIENKEIRGTCFFCLKPDQILTNEHLPPFSSSNMKRVVCLAAQALSEGYRTKNLDFIKNGKIFSDGVVEKRLCTSCQSKNYAEDYKICANLAKQLCDSKLCFPNKYFIGFVKQILSMFLVNCSDQFLKEYRENITNYIIDKGNNKFWIPDNINLWIGIYNSKLSRRIGIKSIAANNANVWYGEISFSPFIFVLTPSNIKLQSLLNISNFQNEKVQNIKMIDFSQFDITDDIGFDYQNSFCFETFTNTLEFLYYRSVI
jgi:hypothetical protein